MIALSIVISLTYSLLIFIFIIGFYRIKDFNPEKSNKDSCFSIIIPFRNEAENLSALLNSISKINYPKKKYEIILVNDDSNDDSVEIIKRFKNQKPKLDMSIIDNQQKSNSPKKDAIDLAVKKSKFDWIITTDADCILPENWLKILSEFIRAKNPKMVVMPVLYLDQNNFLTNFQILELLSLQGVTMGSFGINKPFLCNGANLCYEKSCFLEIDGFSGNEKIASGDDIFMLEKMVNKYPNHVKYLKSKEVIVKTKTENKFSDLIAQRVRWAKKTTAYHNSFGKFVGLSVLMMNFWIILLLLFVIFNYINWHTFAYVFSIKFIIDFLLLYPTSVFFQQQKILIRYVMISFLYPFFNVYVAILSFRKSYGWKGRKFSK